MKEVKIHYLIVNIMEENLSPVMMERELKLFAKVFSYSCNNLSIFVFLFHFRLMNGLQRATTENSN